MLAFHGEELGILKRGEKGQQCIVGLEPAHRGIRWCNSFQRPFLDRKIRLHVDVGRFDAVVSEPKGNHGHVDSGLQQMHSAGVSNEMGGYPFGEKAWTGFSGALNRLL